MVQRFASQHCSMQGTERERDLRKVSLLVRVVSRRYSGNFTYIRFHYVALVSIPGFRHCVAQNNLFILKEFKIQIQGARESERVGKHRKKTKPTCTHTQTHFSSHYFRRFRR